MSAAGAAKARTLSTTCCVVGGGPAGMMLGYLLARAGVDVVVLEKHADFLRDFRGDTIHPSTLQVMEELGLLQKLLQRPHNKALKLQVQIGEQSVTIANFSFLPPERAFIALMPQWDFLDFLADAAKRYPGFHLIMQANVTDLIEEGGRVAGVRAATADGPLDVRARLTVGCDGRHSTVRAKAGLEVEDIGAPIDVLWMRISRLPGDPGFGGRIAAGSFFAVLDRGDYFQLAYVIGKGDAERVMRAGLPAFRQTVAKALPFLADRVGELKSWDDVKLLTVRIDRLRKWYRPGLLCIGDAAHAMSPVGGVGINLAIQDAVAAANLLKAAPIGAFGAMAYTIGKYGPQAIGNLAGLILTFYATSALFILVGLGLIARAAGFRILKFIAYIRDEILVVLGTSSSESALPQLMEKLERLGCSKSVVGLVVPTGYSFNLDGTNIYLTLATLFVAQALGVELSLYEQLAILAVAMLTSKGASGVTGAGFVTLAGTLAVVRPELVPGMAIVLGIDKFMSECRAVTNFIGNGVATIVVSAWEGELDRAALSAGLSRRVDASNLETAVTTG